MTGQLQQAQGTFTALAKYRTCLNRIRSDTDPLRVKLVSPSISCS